MTFQEANIYHSKIEKFLNSNSLLKAIELIKEFAVKSDCVLIDANIEDIKTTYNYLLTYFKDGYTDQHRSEIYNKLLQKCYILNDIVYRELSKRESSNLYFSTIRYNDISSNDTNKLLENLKALYDKLETAQLIPLNATDIQQYRANIETVESNIFKSIWSTTSDQYDSLYDKIFRFNFPNYFKEQIISSILLSCIDFFSEKKVYDLFEIYQKSESIELQTRAIVAIIILSFIKSERFLISEGIKERITMVNDNPNFKDDLKSFIIQFIKSKDTERITKKMENELIPQLMKLSPELYKKIKSSKKSFADEDLEANPAWKSIIEDESINKKLQELSELQMDGADVFMSTFAHLKQFPFFQNISNWFLPFHEEYSYVKSNEDDEKVAETISKAPFLCNSDKYSFFFAVKSVPDKEKGIMLSQFSSQSLDLKEIKSSDLNTEVQNRDAKIAAYVQDLYRFYKLFNRKSEFKDPFTYRPFKDNSLILDQVGNNDSLLQVVGEFYFKHKYYEEALNIFKHSNDGNISSTYQKMGFCYQNLNNYDEALEMYTKADIIESGNSWNLKHIAFCYKLKGDFKEALKYYQIVETKQPDNLSLLLNIGHVLLELKQLQDALKYYYKVDYLSTNNMRAIRPIAWTEFLIGNYTKSQEYYDKIPYGELTPQDYLNIGHLQLVQGQVKSAISTYKTSSRLMADNNINFEEEFMSDTEILKEKGINESTFPFIIDCLYVK